jgi:hypothetical protein
MPPTTLPDPDHDPDGLKLMASLRARLSGGSNTVSAKAERYQPALAALARLVANRQDQGAPRAEIQRLESLQRDLQALARGI